MILFDHELIGQTITINRHKKNLLGMSEVPYVGNGRVCLLSDVQNSIKWVASRSNHRAAGKSDQRNCFN